MSGLSPQGRSVSTGSLGCQGWGSHRARPGLAHSPSPKKRMRFLAAVWMGCSFFAVSRAWAAWRFQKAGSSSSTGRAERGGQVSLGGVPRVWGAAGRCLVTWDDAKGQPRPQAQQQQQHAGPLHACRRAGGRQGQDSGQAGAPRAPERGHQLPYEPPGLWSRQDFGSGCKRLGVPPFAPGGHPGPAPPCDLKSCGQKGSGRVWPSKPQGRGPGECRSVQHRIIPAVTPRERGESGTRPLWGRSICRVPVGASPNPLLTVWWENRYSYVQLVCSVLKASFGQAPSGWDARSLGQGPGSGFLML